MSSYTAGILGVPYRGTSSLLRDAVAAVWWELFRDAQIFFRSRLLRCGIRSIVGEHFGTSDTIVGAHATDSMEAQFGAFEAKW